jgi:hypothetical protein
MSNYYKYTTIPKGIKVVNFKEAAISDGKDYFAGTPFFCCLGKKDTVGSFIRLEFFHHIGTIFSPALQLQHDLSADSFTSEFEAKLEEDNAKDPGKDTTKPAVSIKGAQLQICARLT